MSRARQAREEIKAAIDRHGGVYALAEATSLHFTQIYAFLRGGGMKEPNAGRLRAALPELDAELWADAFAPMPDDAPASSAGAS